MSEKRNLADVKKIAAAIDTEIRALAVLNTPNVRAIRRRYSQKLKQTKPTFILELARVLMNKYKHQWAAYELIQSHKASFQCIRKKELEEFGCGINSWWTVDSFARILSGPAWLNGQVSDKLIHKWALKRSLVAARYISQHGCVQCALAGRIRRCFSHPCSLQDAGE